MLQGLIADGKEEFGRAKAEYDRRISWYQRRMYDIWSELIQRSEQFGREIVGECERAKRLESELQRVDRYHKNSSTR